MEKITNDVIKQTLDEKTIEISKRFNNYDISDHEVCSGVLKKALLYALEEEDKEEFIKKFDFMMSKKANNIIIKKIQETKSIELRNKFIEENINLAFSFASCNSYIYNLIEKDEIKNISFISLTKALNKFDTELDLSFSTYACAWIKSGINRYVQNNCKDIRVPEKVCQKMNEIMIKNQEFIKDFGYEPNNEELMMITDCDKKTIADFYKYSMQMKYLDEVNNNEDKYNSISSNSYTDEIAINSEFKSELLEYMKNVLNEKQFITITMRYGLYDDVIHTYEAIGKILNMTKNGARDIEKKALKKLKETNDMKKFHNYFN